jgi:hypothetical protein
LMFLGQVKQAVERADRLGAAVLEHGYSPGSAARTQEPAATE